LTPAEEAELELRGEADRCRAAGLEFHSFPIPDRGVPRSRSGMAQLVGRLDAALAVGKNVAVHCRQGLGRSSMLVALLLVSREVDPIEAFRRIGSARGTTVPETAEQLEWVAKVA
jgi:protein-tyrosine phosphatase